MKRVTIAIVEASPVILEGVVTMLSRSPQIRIVGSVATVSELQMLLERHDDVDVVVASTAFASQLEGVAELQALPIVGLQSVVTNAESLRRFAAVATIYAEAEELQRVVLDATEAPVEHNYAESHELSERERDVLVLVARGFTNKEIASELNISPHTVISHRKNIVHKTGIRSVAGLTVYAVLNKFIDSERL